MKNENHRQLALLSIIILFLGYLSKLPNLIEAEKRLCNEHICLKA